MAEQQLCDVLRYIRSVAGTDYRVPTDRELLAAFATGNDQAAFTTLVKRHGPMVMGVCRRVLHHFQDAEDAFQATFILLARQSASIRKPESLASWLHGVAYRMAHNARRSASRRRKHEATGRPAPSASQTAELEWREVQAIVDDEIQRLPEIYRAPFLLFYLDNCKQADIARQLGIKEGTVASRLTHARRLLQVRLSRRGVALPAVLCLMAVSAEAASAAVPGSLVSSVVQAAAVAAAGGAVAEVTSAKVSALLEGAHRAMTLSKSRIATLLLLSAGVLGTSFGFALYRHPGVQATEVAGPESPQAQPASLQATEETAGKETEDKPKPAAAPETNAGEAIEVGGRVLDPDGKPVAGAEVTAVLWQVVTFSAWERAAIDETKITVQTTSDAEGRYRLTVPRPAPATRRGLRVLARVPGRELGWATVDPAATREDAEIRLLPEGRLAGKVIDVQGGPVAGLKIRATRMTRKKGDAWDTLPLPEDSVTATTNEQGRFTFHGVGRDLKVHLDIDDLHCAPKELDVNTGEPEKSGNLALGVAPPQILEGRAVCADTGEPVANAELEVDTYTKSEQGYANGGGAVFGKTDARGRFKVSTVPGSTGFVLVYPPEGQPYLINGTEFDWPKGAVRQEVEVKLSRGLLLHGKITEAGSGKPLAKASVEYQTPTYTVKGKVPGGWRGRVLTTADGSYTLAVPPGPARLLVTAPTPDYIAELVGSADIELAKPGGDPFYYHAAAALDLKENDKPKEMSFALRRGVTLKGTLVDPDGKPVKDAVLLVGHHRPPWEKALSPLEIHDGHWELRGCDPERTYHLLFLACPDKPGLTMTAEGIGSTGRLLLPMLLGPKNELGTAVEVSAKNAEKEPLEVRLKPTGSARLHLVDAQGKPVAQPQPEPSLELVVSPGPTFAAALESGAMAGETVYLATNFGELGKKPGSDDPPGTLTVQGLIPGATYRVRQYQQPKALKDFTVESGKTIDVDVPLQ
jgi:RNA polymerase sigma factor (sigma-70 family)